MAKLTLSDLSNLQNESTAVATINNNNTAIETALENTLSRDGTSPNTMGADLDMNSNNILNLPYPASSTEPVRLGDLDDLMPQIFTQASAPSTSEPEGSLWIDTDSADQDLYQLVSGSWTDTTANVRGNTGDTGATGPANSLSIGTVTQGAAAATITGTVPTQTLNLVLPQGDTGETGATGSSISVYVQTSAPSTSGVPEGSLWIDSDDNSRLYKLTSGSWADQAVNLKGADGAGTGDVTAAAANTADNRVVRTDGSSGKGIQESVIALDDTTGTLYPVTNDSGALGKAATSWSDLFLASGAVINFNNGDVTATHSANALAFAGASSGYTFDAVVTPAASDGAALGTSSVMWSDLFLASGGVINWNNSDVLLTHSSDLLTVTGGTILVNAPSVDPAQGIDTFSYRASGSYGGGIGLADGTFNQGIWVSTSPANRLVFGYGTSLGALTSNMELYAASLTPATSDGLALGTTALMWSDLFLASGGVINFNNGNATLTHSTGLLTSNVPVSLGTSNAFTCGSIELGHATANTLTASSGVLSCEGVAQLKLNGNQTLTGGFSATSYSAGTKSTGTYTPAASDGNLQYATNGGAHTLAPPSTDCTIVVQYTNNGSAGSITTSGFTKVTGDTLTTTNGDDYLCFITKINGFSHLHKQLLQ